MNKFAVQYGVTVFFVIMSSMAWSADIVEMKIEDNATRMRLVLTENVEVKHFTLNNPERVVIDFSNTRRTIKFPTIEKNSIIEKIRGAQRNSDYRIVIDLKQVVALSLDKVYASDKKISYVRIDLIPSKKPNASGVTTGVSQSSAKDNSNKKAIKQAGDIANNKRPILIAIDAGHGGSDSGAISKEGVKEKNVVLAISKELEKLLDNEQGFRSKVIRREDVYVRLEKRRDLARKQKADLFVSIHADAFPDERVSGASVYVLSRKGASSATAKFLADNQNISDKLADIKLSNKDALLKEVLVDLAMNDKMSASVGIGQALLERLDHVTKLHSSRVENAAFAVLKTPDLPAVLIETGFISNIDEADNLDSPRFQKKIARAIFQGIEDYFSKNPPAGTYLAWKKKH